MILATRRQHLRRRSCLAVVLLAISLAACLPERSQSVLPAATVRNLMVGVTIPAAKVVFEAAAELPTTTAEWQRVGASAQALADAGSRLTVGARGSGKDDWVRLARAMAGGAERASEAAQRQDNDAFSAAGNEIYEACEACHKSFLRTEAEARKVSG